MIIQNNSRSAPRFSNFIKPFVCLVTSRSARRAALDALVSLTLADICFLRVFNALLFSRDTQYYANSVYSRIDYISALTNILLVGSAIFCGIRATRRLPYPWIRFTAQLSFLALLLPLFDFLRRFLNIGFGIFLKHGPFIFAVEAAAAIFIIVHFRRKLVEHCYKLLLFTSPFLAFTTIRLSTEFAASKWPTADIPLVPIAAGVPIARNPPRVVWVIFDEWDERIMSQIISQSQQFPNIRALQAKSLVGTNVYPPAGNTLYSIPSLLCGQILAEVKPASYGTLLVRTAKGGKLQNFRDTENLFAISAIGGSHMAVAGWFHPYSELVPKGSSIAVHWEPIPLLQDFRAASIGRSIYMQERYVFLPFRVEETCVDSFSRIDAFAHSAIRNPNITAAFIHYNIPHMPGIYDPAKNRLSLRIESVDHSYRDNLLLVDKVIGEILRDLEASKLTSTTTLILSSDHWWRDSPLSNGLRDHRVPFMIHLAGQSDKCIFTPRINSVHTLEVLQRIADGSIRTIEELRERLATYEIGLEYHDFHYDPAGYLRFEAGQAP